MRSCLKNVTNTDVIIHCSDGTAVAHKLVLASISQMMFVEFSISQEETTSIIIPDCSTEEITNYLDAVYSCKSLSRFHSLNQMFGYEMAVNFLPNLLHYNKKETELEEDESDNDHENNEEVIKKEEDLESEDTLKSQGEERKPVIISFFKQPATDGVKKVISFMKKDESPSPGRTKSSKVWVHFDEDPDDSTKRRCKHCGHVVVSPDKSTWTMHAHIVKEHREKVFSYSDGIILQNFPSDVVREPNPSPSRPRKETDDSSIDPETGELMSKSKKRKSYDPSPSRSKEEKNDSSIDPETGEIVSKSKKAKRAKVWQYFDEDTDQRAICRICSAVVPRLDSRSNKDLENHLTTEHQISTKKQETLMCSICGKTFTTKSARNRHERVHLEQWQFYCSFCGKGFMEESRKMRHEKTHTGGNMNIPREEDSFVETPERVSHEKTQILEMPEMGGEDGRRFADKDQIQGLANVQRIPSLGFLYQCDKCLMNFKFLASRNNHTCVPTGL